MDTEKWLFEKMKSEIIGSYYNESRDGTNIMLSEECEKLLKNIYTELRDIDKMPLSVHLHLYKIFYKYYELSFLGDLEELSYTKTDLKGNFGETFMYTNGSIIVKIFDFNQLDHCRSFISEILNNYMIFKQCNGSAEQFILNNIPKLYNFYYLIPYQHSQEIKKKMNIPLNTNSAYGILVFEKFRPFVSVVNNVLKLHDDDKNIENPDLGSLLQLNSTTNNIYMGNRRQMKIQYNLITINMFLEHLFTLWTLRIKLNILMNTAGPLSCVLMHQDKTNYGYNIIYDVDGKEKRIGFDADSSYKMSIVNMDHKNFKSFLPKLLHTYNTNNKIMIDYRFIGTKSFCQEFGEGIYNPRHIWNRVFEHKPVILTLIKSLCDDFFNYNYKHFISPMSITYDQSKYISEFGFNQINHFVVLLHMLKLPVNSITTNEINYKIAIKSRLLEDIFIMNRHIDSLMNNFVHTFEEFPNMRVILKNKTGSKPPIVIPIESYLNVMLDDHLSILIPNITENISFSRFRLFMNLLEKISMGKGFVHMVSCVFMYIDLLQTSIQDKKLKLKQLFLNFIWSISDENRLTYPSVFKYYGQRNISKWYNLDTHKDTPSFAPSGNKLSLLLSSLDPFIKRVAIKRSQWFRMKNSLKLAQPILHDNLINTMLSIYTVHAFGCICNLFNRDSGDIKFKNVWNDIKNPYYKSKMVRIYIKFSYDFDNSNLNVNNKIVQESNVNRIFEYIKDSIYNGNMRTKLETMFIFSRIMSYFIGKLFLIQFEIEKGYDAYTSLLEKERDRVIDRYQLSGSFVTDQCNKFKRKVSERYRIPGAAPFKSAKEYLEKMYENFEKQIWMPIAISANYDLGYTWLERVDINNKQGTPDSGYIKEKNASQLSIDKFEFVVDNTRSFAFTNRGVDNFRLLNILDKKTKDKLGDTHPDLGMMYNDFGLETISGVSGHAANILFSFKLFNLSETSNSLDDLKMVLLGCIAYMLPRKDHTIMEIVEASKAFGINCEGKYETYNCLQSLIPETYTFNSKSKTKEEYMRQIEDSMGASFDSYATSSYYDFANSVYNIMISDNDIMNITKEFEKVDHIEYLRNAKVKNIDNPITLYKELYILFAIFRREAEHFFIKKTGSASYELDSKLLLNLFDKYTCDYASYAKGENLYSEYLNDYTIYRFEDDEITPLQETSYRFPLQESFERNALFFLKYYFNKMNSSDNIL